MFIVEKIKMNVKPKTKTNTNVLHRNIDQTLINSLHGLLKSNISGLDCCVYTAEYISCPLNTHVTYIL